MSVPVHSGISKGMRNTEHLWSRKMVKIMETACIENTNRIACGTINALLHREGSTHVFVKSKVVLSKISWTEVESVI